MFTCGALRTHFSSLYESCVWTSSGERQRQSREKLEQQKAFLGYEKKQLEQQVEELERRKVGLLSQRRVKEAKEVVREKYKVLKKYEKVRELYEFTDTLLEQILNSATMRDTINTINEAQRVYLSMDQTKIYSRYAKLSEKFTTVQEQVAETQGMMSDFMSSGSDDSELLAELEACDSPVLPSMPLPVSTLTPPATVDPPTGGITTAYARAGLHAGT
jgi:DNA repair ATPase RecN